MILRPMQAGGKRSSVYHVRTRTPHGTMCQFSLEVRTHAAAAAMARKIDRLRDLRRAGERLDDELLGWVTRAPRGLALSLRKHGFSDITQVAAGQSIQEHAKAWVRSLSVGGRTPKRVKWCEQAIGTVIEALGAHTIGDLSQTAVEKWLFKEVAAERITESQRARYSGALRQFGAWCHRSGLVDQSPVEHLRPGSVKGKERGGFSIEEIAKLLLAAAADTERREGYPDGLERALIYGLAVTTGLRAGEIRSLRRESFDLDSTPATVTVEAGSTKNRKKAIAPIVDAGLLAGLREHLATKAPATAAFCMPEKTARMLRDDLRRAGLTATEGDGRDFHNLRHSFITLLAKSGVAPKDAQRLARHSSITLTMDRYTHSDVAAAVRALGQLPALAIGAGA